MGYHADFGILLDMVGASDAVFHQEGTSMELAPHVVDKIWTRADELGYGERFKTRETPLR